MMSKNVTKISLFVLGMLSLAKPEALSCSCDPTPTFLEDVTESTTIVLAEVLQHGALPHRAISQYITEKLTKRTAATNSHLPEPPPYPYPYQSYTLMRVIEVIKGEVRADTLVFFNGDGGACKASLRQAQIGKRVVLKLFGADEHLLAEAVKEHLKSRALLDEVLDTHALYASGTCHQWMLDVEGEYVEGNITRNERLELVKNHRQSVTETSEDGLAAYADRLRKAKPERMLYVDFRALVAAVDSD